MVRQIQKNPNGDYLVEGKYLVKSNDSKYGRINDEYNQNLKAPTGDIVGSDGGRSTSGTGTPSLNYDRASGTQVRADGKQFYSVGQNDPRYGTIRNETAAQNGGIYKTGTISNPTGYDIYAGILDKGYQASRKAAQGQIDAAVGTLQGSIGKANSQYDSANRAAYVNYMQGQQNMAQMLKSMGLTKTGAAESTILGANTDYASRVNQNESDRQQALQDIYNRIAETQANGAATLADIDRELGNNLGNAYSSMLSADRSQDNADRDYRLQREQMDYQKKQDERSNLMDDISVLQSMGVTGSALLSRLNQMGYNLTADDLAVYNAQRLKSLK